MIRAVSDKRGAIFVEYAIAIVPMFALFWGLLQLNGLLLADLVVRDAAEKAVRAAVVCDSDHATTGKAGGLACAQEAAAATVKAEPSISDAEVISLDGAASSGNQEVTAVVVAHYTCEVPLVGALVCGAFRGEGTSIEQATLERSAKMPNQGAYYVF